MTNYCMLATEFEDEDLDMTEFTWLRVVAQGPDAVTFKARIMRSNRVYSVTLDPARLGVGWLDLAVQKLKVQYLKESRDAIAKWLRDEGDKAREWQRLSVRWQEGLSLDASWRKDRA